MKTNTCRSSQATSQALGRQRLAIKEKFQANGVSEFPVYTSTIHREHRLPEECYHTHTNAHTFHTLLTLELRECGRTCFRQAKVGALVNMTVVKAGW